MTNILLSTIKKVIGTGPTRFIAPFYHGLRGLAVSVVNSNPSGKLQVIGVTGTKGKTSTTVIIGRILNLAGIKTGYISTSTLCEDGNRGHEYLNPYKMTSIDPAIMHRKIAKMVQNGCRYLVIELSSEGLFQNRHWGLGGIDIGVFLNLYPEHIESHGGLHNYMKAKAKLFSHLKQGGTFIGNSDNGKGQNEDQLVKTEFMYNAIPDKIKPFIKKILIASKNDFRVLSDPNSLFKTLELDGNSIPTNFIASFEITNLVFALNVLAAVDKKSYQELISTGKGKLLEIHGLPGRMEWVVLNGKVV